MTFDFVRTAGTCPDLETIGRVYTMERFANRISDVLQTFPLVCRENYGIEHDIVRSDRHDRSRYIYCIINGVIEIVQPQKYFKNVILCWLEQVLI